MRIPILLVLFAICPKAVHAAEFSPWFGNEGQEAFQLEVTSGAEPAIVAAATVAADADCPPEGCPDGQIVVKGPEETAKAP